MVKNSSCQPVSLSAEKQLDQISITSPLDMHGLQTMNLSVFILQTVFMDVYCNVKLICFYIV